MENEPLELKPELTVKKAIVLFFAEFFGTAVMMYVGCAGCVLEKYIPLQPMVVAATFGIGIMASVQIFGHISGPHLNPGVSLGAFILGKMHWKKMLIYMAGQYTGCFFGYTALWVQMPESSTKLKPCALLIQPYLTPVKVLFIEFTISMILFMVVGGVEDTANARWRDSIPLRFGFIIFGLVVAAAEMSGACINSARALPSAVWNNVYDSHWAFHLGPYLGMICGAVLYRFVFDTTDKNSLNRAE